MYHRFTHRIGKGKEQVWYHNNFLRGVPEYMQHMVRTKIKGDCSFFRGDVPHFDDMPPLPIGDKQPPPDVLNEMEEAILKLKRSSSFVQSDLKAMPPNLNETDLTFSPRYEHHPHEFGVVSFNNPDERFMPPRFSVPRFNFFGGQSVPSMHAHLPLPSKSMAYASASYQEVQSPTLRVQEQAPKSNVCPFSPIKQGGDDEATFEPLPFRFYNNSCHGDDFSNFIGSTIRHVEGQQHIPERRT